MYKIMLADDEGIVIDALKFIIDKEFGKECEIAYAKTGRKVIELAEAFRPDIAIMDIQMPGINGIEAMKEIRRTNDKVIFIVMSAYDKFDYAQEAMKLGVQEYIMKPMDKNKIIGVLKKSMENVDRERRRRSDDLKIREKLETVIPIIESGMIYNLLFQKLDGEDVDNYRALLGLEQDHFYMIAIVFGDEQEGSHMTNVVGSSVKMQKFYRDVREFVKEEFPCVMGSAMANKIAVLVPYGQKEMDYNERIVLIERARELVRRMRKHMDIRFRIGIGGVGELDEMSRSYEDALRALSLATGSVVHADDMQLHCAYDEGYPVELEKQLFDRVEQGDLNGAIATAKSFFSWMRESNASDLMDIRLKILEFVLWAEKLGFSKGGRVYHFSDRKDYLPEVMGKTELGELEDWFLNKITDVCQMIVGSQQKKAQGTIDQAVQYIKAHFQKEISLVDVSRQVNVSPYYFSKIFKEATGENFIEYLTNLRIEKAKELLLETEYSVKEICLQVGYSEPNYFSRSFKKNVGVTPTEYKEGIREPAE
ncbi:MAG: response regulator [Lachnospiraceae bacterium]|nr:response regulator [Lachnospiraceae bacterium]